MEDEDFGFAKRDYKALNKISSTNIDKSGNNDNLPKRNCGSDGDEFYRRRSSEDRAKTIAAPPQCPNINNNNTVAAASANAAPQSSSGYKRSSGSGGSSTSSSSSTSSVPTDAPHIPNVVEYHLKVKPCPRVYRLEDFSRDQQHRNREEMKKDLLVSPINNNNNNSNNNNNKDVVSKLSNLSINKNVFEGSTDLPQVFQVKYLGSHDARGLWGIKHTRQPVDNMVAAAKALPSNTMLPLIKLVVSKDGVALLSLDAKRKQDQQAQHQTLARMYPIETISYGVQDLVYTRVFSMIVVRDTDNFRRVSPFECHGFVCESKYHARQLTCALATAFEFYSKLVKAQDDKSKGGVNNNHHSKNIVANNREKFAIDLRSPDEIEADLCRDSEA